MKNNEIQQGGLHLSISLVAAVTYLGASFSSSKSFFSFDNEYLIFFKIPTKYLLFFIGKGSEF